MLRIWIDNDACPGAIKDVIFKASRRLNIAVVMVANRAALPPRQAQVSVVTVPHGADVADAYIIDQVAIEDIVVTADIPLAAAVVEKGAVAINPRGEAYTEANIKERQSMRDFMMQLRSEGVIQGGAGPFSTKDRERFANALDRLLAKAR